MQLSWTNGWIYILRFVYPHKKVYAVYALSKKRIHRNAQWWSEFERRAYGPRAVQSLDELLALDQSDWVYLGFDENFPIANLRETLDKFAWQSLSRWLNEKLDSMDPLNHLTTSWMWCHPALTFTELARSGHYFAFRVKLNSAFKAKDPPKIHKPYSGHCCPTKNPGRSLLYGMRSPDGSAQTRVAPLDIGCPYKTTKLGTVYDRAASNHPFVGP